MSKRNSQLVCQYVEDMSRAMLDEYQDVIRNYVRATHLEAPHWTVLVSDCMLTPALG
jgi:hypothetical protein